jgi:hypothetical protein
VLVLHVDYEQGAQAMPDYEQEISMTAIAEDQRLAKMHIHTTRLA